LTADRARWNAARPAAAGWVEPRTSRLPGRIAAVARRWLEIVGRHYEEAKAHDRLAALHAAAGDFKAANSAVEAACALRDGYASPEAARQDRLRRGTAAWEEHFGPVASAEVQDRMAAYNRAVALDELRAKEEAGRQAAARVSRRNRRGRRA
jgi:hypothetical protein